MHPAAEHSDPHTHKHSRKHASAGAQVYNARRPEQTLLYRTVAEHFETWQIAFSCKGRGVCPS